MFESRSDRESFSRLTSEAPREEDIKERGPGCGAGI